MNTPTQTSFAELEYASKKRQTRREKFLAEMWQVVPCKVDPEIRTVV